MGWITRGILIIGLDLDKAYSYSNESGGRGIVEKIVLYE
jgi:hypothetical protein